MPGKPRFSYFISSSDHPITEKNALWKTPLPLDRRRFVDQAPADADESISYESYFFAVRSFLEKNRCEILTSAASQHFNRKITQKDLKEIRIRLEKHGEYYHPSRVDVILDQETVSFVVNVAVSEAGRQ